MTRASCWCVAIGALAASLVAVPTSADTGGQFAAPGIRAPSDPDVNGLRFSVLYGKNDSVRGLDIGLLSISETKTLSGVGLVLGIGKVTGEMDGGAHFSDLVSNVERAVEYADFVEHSIHRSAYAELASLVRGL